MTSAISCTEQKPQHLFRPGESGNPLGRPKGSVGGRAKALALLDSIVAEDDVQNAIGTAIRKEAMEHPIRFFKTIVIPLLPQNIKVAMAEEGAVTWVSLLSAFPPGEPAAAAIP